jgi:hypothetical protein
MYTVLHHLPPNVSVQPGTFVKVTVAVKGIMSWYLKARAIIVVVVFEGTLKGTLSERVTVVMTVSSIKIVFELEELKNTERVDGSIYGGGKVAVRRVSTFQIIPSVLDIASVFILLILYYSCDVILLGEVFWTDYEAITSDIS